MKTREISTSSLFKKLEQHFFWKNDKNVYTHQLIVPSLHVLLILIYKYILLLMLIYFWSMFFSLFHYVIANLLLLT